jgi:hypothetical protein
MSKKKTEEVYINGYKFQKVYNTTLSFKPVRCDEINDGRVLLIDCLKYLIRVIPQNDSSFETLVSLTSFLINNNNCAASKKQDDLIRHFLDYWKSMGYLDV